MNLRSYGIPKALILSLTMGIFSTAMIFPLSIQGQLTNNITNSTSETLNLTKILPSAPGGYIIFNPSIDDTSERNCVYGGVGYSPGSVVNMPNGTKTCWEDEVWRK
ncbi:MAG: hypothetical protein P0116_10760 [Candidatus Nitrosocosmicus sp.]|nr:hypothetical protein [Candidatus Nitrosocosmicus sp.]